MKTVVYKSLSKKDTKKIALELSKTAVKGSVYALIGDLGCGKTLFSKAFAKGIGITETVVSPTFTLLEIYKTDNIELCHFDLYRINNVNEFDNLFFEDYWESDAVCLIEWADKALHLLPGNTMKIMFDYISENERRITVEYPDN